MEMEALKIAISIPFDISCTQIYIIYIPENLCNPVTANIQPCQKGAIVMDKGTAGTVKGSGNSEDPGEKGRIDIEALRKELPPVSNDELPDLSDGKKWYYNTRTGDVEYGKLSSFTHRMGPYDTREDAERALKIAQAAYRFGERGFLEVLDAQRVFRAARAELIAARFELAAAWVDIERLRATPGGNRE